MTVRWSLTARLATLFAAMASGLLIVVGILIDRSVSTHFDELDLHALTAKVVTIETLLDTTTSYQALDALPDRVTDALAGHDSVALWLAIPQYEWVYSVLGDRFDGYRDLLNSSGENLIQWQDSYGASFIGRAVQQQIPLPEPAEIEVLIGLDISHHEHFLKQLRLRLGIGISVATLLAAMLGWLAAYKGLAPMRRVASTARNLSAKQLGERLSTADVPPEMQELVEAFNGMLERLEASFRRLNEFSADIAHELRSPVSNLMTETQVALSRVRSADEYREALHSNLEEFDRLARMIADMLFLAKADNGMLPKPVEQVVLETEVLAMFEFYEALAEEKQLRMKLSGTGVVVGDRLMLRRALSNLLSNAIRHTPKGMVIEVIIKRESGTLLLSISNPGEPIPPDQIPLVFERFHRVDPSRLRQGDGSGLGLSITRSIIEAHGGQILLMSDADQTTFTIRLPI